MVGVANFIWRPGEAVRTLLTLQVQPLVAVVGRVMGACRDAILHYSGIEVMSVATFFGVLAALLLAGAAAWAYVVAAGEASKEAKAHGPLRVRRSGISTDTWCDANQTPITNPQFLETRSNEVLAIFGNEIVRLRMIKPDRAGAHTPGMGIKVELAGEDEKSTCPVKRQLAGV